VAERPLDTEQNRQSRALALRPAKLDSYVLTIDVAHPFNGSKSRHDLGYLPFDSSAPPSNDFDSRGVNEAGVVSLRVNAGNVSLTF
jgi:hypothetical protein